MADPKKKKTETAETTPTVAETRKKEAEMGTLDRVSTPAVSDAPKKTVKGLKGEDIKVDDTLTKSALTRLEEQEKEKKVENTIKDTYNSTMSDFGARISEMEEAKKKAKEGDEVAQRRARSMQMVAGISDGLASLANLIGVAGYNSSNINTGSALSPLEQKMEAARLERKADIKSIDDRLEQYRNQMDQIRMQKGSALANLYQHKENQAFQREQTEKKILADMRNTEAKLRSTAMENALNRSNQLTIAKTRAEATKEAAETRANAAKTAAGSKKAKEQFILTDAEGNESVYSMPKETAAAMLRDFDSIIQSDIANDETSGATSSAFRQAYERYQDILQRRSVGMGSEKEVTDARNALISLSPTMQEKIKQYGTSSTANPTDEEPVNFEELDEVDAILESHK